MSLQVTLISAFVPKDVLEAHFPGGLRSFRLAYPGQPEDEHLVRFAAMGWDDLEAPLDALRLLGVPVEGNVAIADMLAGPMSPRCERIAIEAEGDGPFTWHARFVC